MKNEILTKKEIFEIEIYDNLNFETNVEIEEYPDSIFNEINFNPNF